MKLRKKDFEVPKNFVLFLKKVHSWGGVTEMVLGLCLLFL